MLDYIEELKEAVEETGEQAAGVLRDNHTTPQFCAVLARVLRPNRRAPATIPLARNMDEQQASELLVKVLRLKTDVKLLDVKASFGDDLFAAAEKAAEHIVAQQAERGRERAQQWAQIHTERGGKLNSRLDEDEPSV